MGDMEKPPGAVKCYIAAPEIRRMDPFFEAQGFSRKLLIFAIPSLGIVFRCRADGDPIELEFGAFFSLLRFIEDRLPQADIRQVEVYSSNPEFVFSFASRGGHLSEGSSRKKLLKEHSSRMGISVKYIAPQKNIALTSSADYPCLPLNRRILLKPGPTDRDKIEIKPIQKGLWI